MRGKTQATWQLHKHKDISEPKGIFYSFVELSDVEMMDLSNIKGHQLSSGADVNLA